MSKTKTNTNTNYILASAAVIITGVVSIIGSINLISNITPTVFADEDLPHCTDIKRYERWESNPTSIVSSPIDITEDEIASYSVPDQTVRCKVEFNLNGHTVSEAYTAKYYLRNNLIIGENVVATINGGGGSFDVGSPQDEPCEPGELCHSSGGGGMISGGWRNGDITVASGSELILNDVVLRTSANSIYVNAGAKAELNNVTANYNLWNDGGELIVNSGDYQTISTRNGGQTTVNDGVFRDVEIESGSNITINGGTILDRSDNPGGTIMSIQTLSNNSGSLPRYNYPAPTNDITINGGNFENLTINTPVTITGGTFVNSNFDSINHYIDPGYGGSGGGYDASIDPAPSVISGGIFTDSSFKDITDVSDGTFTNTNFTGETLISDGTFTGSTFSDDTTINNGVFMSSTIPEEATISGGTFDTIPEPETISTDKKVIENNDGSYSVVDESAPGEEPIKPCEARLYTTPSTYTTFNTALNIYNDVTASIVVTDQDENCRLVVNINNGSTLTGVENMETISVGDNASLKINGNDGEIKQNNSSTNDDTAVIQISDGATASIKDVTISTNNENGTSVSNSGATTLNNVTAEDNSVKNADGKLTVINSEIGNIEASDSAKVIINDSEIGNITAENNSTVEINGGEVGNVSADNNSTTEINGGEVGNVSAENNSTIEINGGETQNVSVEDNSSVQVSDGKVESITGDSNSNINISGGEFTDSNISSESDNTSNVVVSGGTFNNTTFDSPATIVGGEFTDSSFNDTTDISNGTFTDTNFTGETSIADGTFTDTNFTGETSIVDGTFTGSTFSDDTTITDGTFTGSIISDGTTVSGGTFDTILDSESVSEGKKIVENDDGTYSIVDESEPGEEIIKPCEARVYTDASTYTIVNTVINIDTDTTASIIVTDQNKKCRLTVNLNNGSTLTSVENMETISVGDKADLKINGNDGEIKQNSDSTDSDTPAIKISDGATADIKDVTISTNNGDAGILNSGSTTLDNVTTDENGVKNENGELIVTNSEIGNIESTNSGSVIVDGSKIDDISADNNSTVEINGGEVGNVSAGDNSTVEINGGEVGNVSAGDNSTIEINGGEVGSVSADNNSTTEINSGEVGSVSADNNSTAEINGGEVGNVSAGNDSSVQVSDGKVESITGDSNSNINISGGDFTNSNISSESGNADNIVVSGGTFNNTTFDSPITVSGGDFENTIIPSESKTVEANPNENTNQTKKEATKEEVAKEETVKENKDVKVPDTGIALFKNSGSRPVAIAAIVAAEATILMVCEYILHHIKNKRKINFCPKEPNYDELLES